MGASDHSVPPDLLTCCLTLSPPPTRSRVRSIAQTRPDPAGHGARHTPCFCPRVRGWRGRHIGDRDAYLFRDGVLFQITHDHS